MARIRTIKPEFWSDEKLAVLSAIDRLVFLGLIGMADDNGRILDNEKTIDAFIFPYTPETSRDTLARLSRLSRVRRGTAACGKKIIEIINWEKHQRVDKPQVKGLLPEIVEYTDDTLENVGETAIRGSLATLSRQSPESLATPSGLDLVPSTKDLVPSTEDQGPSLSASESGPPAYSPEFEEWWSNFPKQRRSQKGSAYAKWKRIVKDLNPGYLLQRVRDYAASDIGKSEFAVMPERWLNSRMWEDDPASWERKETPSKPEKKPFSYPPARDPRTKKPLYDC